MSAIENNANIEITIRPAGPADAERLRTLRLAGLAGDPTAFSSDYASSSQDPLETWVTRLERYAQGVNESMQVAEAGDQLVGMAGIFRDPRPKIRHTGTVFGVYVDPAMRGRKLGERLVRACLEWAAGHELAVVKLGVNSTNAAAIQCYLRCGFAVYGVEPKAI